MQRGTTISESPSRTTSRTRRANRHARVNTDWPNHLAKINGWQYLNGNPAGMKEHISTYGAVIACFVVFQDFFSYRSGVYRHVTGDPPVAIACA